MKGWKIDCSFLVDDGGAIEMLKLANTYVEVHLFLLHIVSNA